MSCSLADTSNIVIDLACIHLHVNSIKHYKQKGAVVRSLFIVMITAALTWLLVATKPQPQANLQSVKLVIIEVMQVEKRSI